jgi:hypothetical protein
LILKIQICLAGNRFILPIISLDNLIENSAEKALPASVIR